MIRLLLFRIFGELLVFPKLTFEAGDHLVLDMTKESDLEGMTVNERLIVLGLLPEFDQAAVSRNRDELVKILTRAQFSERQALETADALLRGPARYGY